MMADRPFLAIIDYGMGNLRSVQKGFERVGFPAKIVTRPDALDEATGLVLPGVGAFGDAMDNLNKAGFSGAIATAVAAGKPLLGICLGLQLLFEESSEGGHHTGLGLLPGQVVRLPGGVKIPHMGWNEVTFRNCALWNGLPGAVAFYFVHSYYILPRDTEICVGHTDYGVTFPVAVAAGNIYGVQFHPEKSSRWGLKVLRNYGELVLSCC